MRIVCLSTSSCVIWQLLQADPEKEQEEGATELAVSAFLPLYVSDLKLVSRESKDNSFIKTKHLNTLCNTIPFRGEAHGI